MQRPAPTILYRNRYIAPKDAARMVLAYKRTCQAQCSYLDCIVSWIEVKNVTREFANVVPDPRVSSPDTFLDWYKDNFKKFYGKQKQKGGRTAWPWKQSDI